MVPPNLKLIHNKRNDFCCIYVFKIFLVYHYFSKNLEKKLNGQIKARQRVHLDYLLRIKNEEINRK